jgi:hypothetical protein
MAFSFRRSQGVVYAEVAKKLSLLRVLLLLATEGDTKVGAGQSQDRG